MCIRDRLPSGAASPVKYPVVASIARLLLGLPSNTKKITEKSRLNYGFLNPCIIM